MYAIVVLYNNSLLDIKTRHTHDGAINCGILMAIHHAHKFDHLLVHDEISSALKEQSCFTAHGMTTIIREIEH